MSGTRPVVLITGGNSGIGIRTPRLGWPSGDGMEMQIWDKPHYWPMEKQQTMAIYSNVPPLVRAVISGPPPLILPHHGNQSPFSPKAPSALKKPR